MTPTPSPAPTPVNPAAPPVVSIRNVSLAFGGVSVLEQVTLDIQPGEFLALLGPNGAGKSTLLKLIAGLLEPSQGQVLVFGETPQDLGRQRLRMGYMPQAGTVNERFPVTAAGVVMMGRYATMGLGRYPSREDRQAVAQALAKTGVEHLGKVPLSKLSGGQRQRVFLARALVNQPQMLLLDEPTSAMDTSAVEYFYTLLEQLSDQGITLVIVSHDVSVVASRVDRVACLNRRLVAHGRPDMVIDDGVMQDMYGCHTMFFTHGPSPHMVVRKHPG